MSTAVEPRFTPEEPGHISELEGVIIRPMLTLDDAIDFACSSLAPKTRADYTRLLHRFAELFPRNWDVAKITEDDFVRYLAGRPHLARSTRAWEEKVLYSTFQKLYKARKIRRNPMEFVPRTIAPDPETLDLVRVSSGEAFRMLSAAETWPERLCLALLVYLGPRRAAAALVRLRDYDELGGRLRFHEKGGQTIWKPIPDELVVLIDAARQEDVFWPAPRDYVIPPEGPLKASKPNRDDRVVWRIVNRVAKRAGVVAHTHSLRAAFADFCLDSGYEGKTLQLLMGHKNPATTERYIQRYDRELRMEPVRSLSWQRLAEPIPANSDEKVGGQLADGGGRIRTSVERNPWSHAAWTPTSEQDLVEALKQAIHWERV